MASQTTIKAVLDKIEARYRTQLVADPPTNNKPFWTVIEGIATGIETTRPFLAVHAADVRPTDRMDGDQHIRLTFVTQLFTDIDDASMIADLHNKMSEVDDFWDDERAAGFLSGAEGFDERQWKIIHPKETQPTRMGRAELTNTCIVNVGRGSN